MPNQRQLSLQDVYHYMGAVETPGEAILVGGQALNYWALKYAHKERDISAYQPFTSSDIDFIGGQDIAAQLSEAWNGELAIPNIDENTPNTAVVCVPVPNDDPILIDFLIGIIGVDEARASKTAAQIKIPKTNKTIKILHPLYCLTSQLHNVYGQLNRRESDNGQYHVNRAKLAVHVLQAYLNESLQHSSRSAYNVIEELEEIARSAVALKANLLDHIDIMQAIPHEGQLSKEFLEKRLPQIVRNVERRRASYAMTVNRIKTTRPAKSNEPGGLS